MATSLPLLSLATGIYYFPPFYLLCVSVAHITPAPGAEEEIQDELSLHFLATVIGWGPGI